VYLYTIYIVCIPTLNVICITGISPVAIPDHSATSNIKNLNLNLNNKKNKKIVNEKKEDSGLSNSTNLSSCKKSSICQTKHLGVCKNKKNGKNDKDEVEENYTDIASDTSIKSDR
jgi:hypothetical protein